MKTVIVPALLLALLCIVPLEAKVSCKEKCIKLMKDNENITATDDGFARFKQRFEKWNCKKYFTTQDGWQPDGCWRSSCKICSTEHVWASCIISPELGCEKFLYCGNYGVFGDRQCGQLYPPEYVECVALARNQSNDGNL